MSHVVFYDGVCGLCSRVTQFILARDRRDRFRFAQLQGQHARDTLLPRGRDPRDLDTMVVLCDSGDVFVKARAALFVAHELGGWVGWFGRLVAWLPDRLLDWGYDRVARSRYRLFGRTDVCSLPAGADRRKFIDN